MTVAALPDCVTMNFTNVSDITPASFKASTLLKDNPDIARTIEERELHLDSKLAQCCAKAPPVLEFDKEGASTCSMRPSAKTRSAP